MVSTPFPWQQHGGAARIMVRRTVGMKRRCRKCMDVLGLAPWPRSGGESMGCLTAFRR